LSRAEGGRVTSGLFACLLPRVAWQVNLRGIDKHAPKGLANYARRCAPTTACKQDERRRHERRWRAACSAQHSAAIMHVAGRVSRTKRLTPSTPHAIHTSRHPRPHRCTSDQTPHPTLHVGRCL
jgi:hypothetical protein